MEISSAVRAPEDGGLGLLATGGELVARFVATTFRASRLHFSSQECCEHRDFYSHHREERYLPPFARRERSGAFFGGG